MTNTRLTDPEVLEFRYPVVLEERVLQTFPADDPAWEARFTEGMAAARFRCSYLNAEESPGGQG